MKEQIISRKELYDLVWSTPLLRLSKKYAISDTGLKKVCVKMNIPLPKAGHWVKVRLNKSVKIKKLPEKYVGKSEIKLFLRDEDDPVIKGLPSPYVTLLREIIDKESDKLIVPKRLSKPCSLIVPVIKAFNNKERYYNKGRLLRASYFDLNINVSPKQYARVLRFMDTFIKVMINRGHSFYNNHCLTYVVINGEDIQIRVTEKLNRVPIPGNTGWQRYEYSPTGILMFSCVANDNTTTWMDSKAMLEEQLPKIIARLEIIGKRLKDKRMVIEAYWAVEREKQRIREEKQKRIDKERSDFKKLLKTVNRWHVAVDLRNYINKVEDYAKKSNTYSDDLKNWISWARKKTDWYDPLMGGNDEFLNNDDIDKIS